MSDAPIKRLQPERVCQSAGDFHRNRDNLYLNLYFAKFANGKLLFVTSQKKSYSLLKVGFVEGITLKSKLFRKIKNIS